MSFVAAIDRAGASDDLVMRGMAAVAAGLERVSTRPAGRRRDDELQHLLLQYEGLQSLALRAS